MGASAAGVIVSVTLGWTTPTPACVFRPTGSHVNSLASNNRLQNETHQTESWEADGEREGEIVEKRD